MAIRDILKKKDKIKRDGATPESTYGKDDAPLPAENRAPPPEFKFIRTTTDLEEIISPPSFPADNELNSSLDGAPTTKDKQSSDMSPSKRLFNLRKKPKQPEGSEKEARISRSATPPTESQSGDSQQQRLSRRLEDKLHIRPRSRGSSFGSSSIHVPADLPEIDGTGSDHPDKETEWEKRALLLAQNTERSRPQTPNIKATTIEREATNQFQRDANGAPAQESSSGHRRAISDAEGDINIQEAIKLHEAGGEHLAQSTRMLHRLANEQNNAMAQVLYGLALRHGWGCEKDEPTALSYLSLAASNSALVESTAISTGASPRGGPAKGELVLAIYELGNSFRWGWGCQRDPLAARKYYETAANLGDTDAMSEVAWCYLQGFGGPKDKFMAAKYLRMAEAKGVSEPGNSWIWKDKYSPQIETAGAKSTKS